jgi:hypothetical protein
MIYDCMTAFYGLRNHGAGAVQDGSCCLYWVGCLTIGYLMDSTWTVLFLPKEDSETVIVQMKHDTQSP